MQFTLLLAGLAASIASVAAGPIPQPIPVDEDTLALARRSLEIAARAEQAEALDFDDGTMALARRSLEARAEQANQIQALAQARALAQWRANRQWGGYPGRFSQAGGGFDLNVLGGLLDLSAGGGRTDYCTYPYC